MAARAFEARRRGRCFRCSGAIAKGQLIRACAGCYGEWEHVSLADCREAYRTRQAADMATAVRNEWLTQEQADAVLARDDAGAKFPDEEV